MKPADLRTALAGAAFWATAVAAIAPAMAQQQLVSSQLELRSTDAGKALAGAMSRLASDPRDVDALLAAGEAALQLDDPRSALGFFGRADDVSPNNGRVKAGLGRAMLQLDQVGDGLRLMEQAGNLGYRDVGLLSDRGLARDLTGNQRGAQQDYTAALALDPNNEKARRRLAVSHGITGQVELAEATLKPLLYKSDRAAWRDQAFILAMNGKTAQAMDIANQVMPKPLAGAIKPYMERMSMLTPGQRAAAVHMGQFPPGLIDRPVVIVPPSAAQAAVAATSQSTSGTKKGKGGTQVAVVRVPARPDSVKSVQATAAPVRDTQPTGVAAQQPARTAPVATPQPARPAVTPAPAAAPQPTRAGVAAAPAPAGTIAAGRSVQGPPAPTATVPPASAAARPAAPAPVPMAPPSGASAPPDRTLAQIMAEISVPEAERRAVVAPVNLAEIAAIQETQRKARLAAEEKARKAAEAQEAARRKAEADAKAKAEKKRLADNPARYWVQIGVGRNKGALAFTLRRMQKDHSVLAKKDGWSAPWGATNRLVVGPFATLAKAKDVVAEMEKGGSDAFVWRSDAGEELEKVGG